MLYVYLAVGGAVGTVARYAVGGWVHSWASIAFPWGTLTVNLLGSFLLGLAIRAAELSPLSADLRGLLTVGFCGAFTTFSTFTYETLTLMQAGEWARASAYAAGSVSLGIAALALGLAIAPVLVRAAG